MSNKLELRGVLPAMLTPFTEDGSSIDNDAHTALTNRLIDDGDIIHLDVPHRRRDIEISDEELARRAAECKPESSK